MTRTIRPGSAPPRVASNGTVDVAAIQKALDSMHQRLLVLEDTCRALQEDITNIYILLDRLTTVVEGLA